MPAEVRFDYPRRRPGVQLRVARRRPRRAGRSDWPRGVAPTSLHGTLGDFWPVATMAPTMATPADQPLKKLLCSSWLVVVTLRPHRLHFFLSFNLGVAMVAMLAMRHSPLPFLLLQVADVS